MFICMYIYIYIYIYVASSLSVLCVGCFVLHFNVEIQLRPIVYFIYQMFRKEGRNTKKIKIEHIVQTETYKQLYVYVYVYVCVTYIYIYIYIYIYLFICLYLYAYIYIYI